MLLTGATRGLGEGIIRQLCTTEHKPARVVLLARSETKSKVLCESLEAAGISATTYLASLDSMKQVLDVGRAIRDGEKALHVMVLCHTDQPDERKLDQDGLETGYALNYLSNVVLIEQLKPLLARSAPARICVFGTHTACYLSKGILNNAILDSTTRPTSDDLGDYTPVLAGSENMSLEFIEGLWCYSQLGLAKQYYVAAAPEVEGYLPEGVTINCTAPGPTPTEGKNWTRAMEAMGKPQGMWRSFLFWMLNHREVSMGIQGMLTLMGSPVMEGVTGHLLDTGFGGPTIKRRPIPAHNLFQHPSGRHLMAPDKDAAHAMRHELLKSSLTRIEALRARYESA